jgi:hypothetical protein
LTGNAAHFSQLPEIQSYDENAIGKATNSENGLEAALTAANPFGRVGGRGALDRLPE